MRVVIINAVNLFDAYYRVMDATKPAAWNARLANEGRKRLVQLDWLLLEVQRREVDIADHSRSHVEKMGQI